MEIKQFYDSNLAHSSYVILSEGEVAIIDPERDPFQYIEFAKSKNAKITAIVETHLHADFVSAHLELSQISGAKIYVSKIAEVEYAHENFDDGNSISIGKVKLVCINTPGHSPDSISILLFDESEKNVAVFTGDTLFVGDVGRPDLREKDGKNSRNELAENLFNSLHKKILRLSDEILVYPAHGPGSLCGKSLGPELSSTIGKERKTNSALSFTDKNKFVENLLHDQPFVPKYFPYNVLINKKGSAGFEENIQKVKRSNSQPRLENDVIIVDVRSNELFKKGHIKGSINIPLTKTFETWLGTIVSPEEKFFLTGENETSIESGIKRAAKIGYENNILEAFVITDVNEQSKPINLEDFKNAPQEFTILDVRTHAENEAKKIFNNAINIPLQELRNKVKEIPLNKPVVVHCAAGSRSAISASILQKELPVDVYDLSEAIKKFE